MDQQLIEKLKKQMLEQKATIVESLSQQSEDFKRILEEQSSGDEIDMASDAIDRAMLESLNQQDANRLSLIEGALERIQTGKYGLCIRCGKEIPAARLEALPYALMCINCKAKDERRNR